MIAVLALIALVAFLRADRKKGPNSAGRSRTVSRAEIRPTNRRLMTSADSVASPDRALDNVTCEAGPDMACEVPPVVSVAGDESPVYEQPQAACRQVSDI